MNVGTACKDGNGLLDVLWKVNLAKIVFWKRELALRERAQHGKSDILMTLSANWLSSHVPETPF